MYVYIRYKCNLTADTESNNSIFKTWLKIQAKILVLIMLKYTLKQNMAPMT